MTVKDLIERLQKFPEDIEVVFDSDGEGVYMDIAGVGFCAKPYDGRGPVVEIKEYITPNKDNKDERD
jgi:hypothetical protein